MAGKRKPKPSGRSLKVRLRDIRSGPIVHESLTAEQLQKAETIWKIIGPFQSDTLEQFETSLMRDRDPDKELSIWARIAFAFRKYYARRLPPEGGMVDKREAEHAVTAFVLLDTVGMEAALPADVPDHDLLRECWRDPLMGDEQKT